MEGYLHPTNPSKFKMILSPVQIQCHRLIYLFCFSVVDAISTLFLNHVMHKNSPQRVSIVSECNIAVYLWNPNKTQSPSQENDGTDKGKGRIRVTVELTSVGFAKRNLHGPMLIDLQHNLLGRKLHITPVMGHTLNTWRHRTLQQAEEIDLQLVWMMDTACSRKTDPTLPAKTLHHGRSAH